MNLKKITCISMMVVSGVFIAKFFLDKGTSDNNVAKINEVITKKSDDEKENDARFSKESFHELQQQYPNVVAWMVFEDDYISLPIVQGQDNDYYLTHWIDGSYDEQGSIFFSAYSNVENDTNVTIYGHRVGYDENARFSPLLKLVDQENYDTHHTFTIWYADKIRTYDITNVFFYDSYDDLNFDFTQSNFPNINDWSEYKRFINERNLIKADDELSKKDRFISIQTCRNSYSQEKVIVIAKQINEELYPDK